MTNTQIQKRIEQQRRSQERSRQRQLEKQRSPEYRAKQQEKQRAASERRRAKMMADTDNRLEKAREQQQRAIERAKSKGLPALTRSKPTKVRTFVFTAGANVKDVITKSKEHRALVFKNCGAVDAPFLLICQMPIP